MVDENVIVKAIRQAGSIIEPSLTGYKYVSDPNLFPPVKFVPGGYCLSFPLECPGKTPKCLRLWYKNNGKPENPSHIVNVSNYFNKYQIKYVIPYRYIDHALRLTDGTEIPGVVMEWIEGSTLMRFVKDNYKNKTTIHNLANKFYEMAQYHKQYGMAHGDLSDENIIVKPNGGLFLIDYDSFYVSEWGKNIIQSTVGVEWYQHPDRMNGKSRYLNTNMDNFSQQVIYLSLLLIAEDPSLFKGDTEKGLLFKGGDFASLASFRASSLYKKISAIRNSEIQNRLHELERALGGPLSDIRSIVDYIQPAPPKIDYDKEYWEVNKGTVEGCRKYLNRYPSGRFSNEAKGIVANYEKAERARAAIQADDRFWGSNRETIEGCRKYLSRYPSGRHSYEAKKKLSELIKHRTYSIVGWTAGVIVFILLMIWIFSPSTPSATTEEMAPIMKELREQFDNTNGKSTVELCAESQSMDCLEYIDGLIEKAEKMDGGNSDVKYYRNKYDEIKGGALRSIIKELDELFDNSKSTSTVELCVQSRSIDGLQYVNHLIARGESLDKKNKQIKSYRKQFDKLTKGIKI